MLKVKNVYKKYKTKEVLKGVTFNVDIGEIKGLIGVNGAGKSTLTEIICGTKRSNAGDIYIDNINIKDKKNKNRIKNLIGYMPQHFSLFNDLTVEENLGYLCTVYNLKKSKIDEILKICFLEDYKKTLAKNLSGGYKQLLSMASAIIHTPKFLILDEPTASMDPIFRRNFWKIVHKCKSKSMTVLVITHYMEELIECDSFICLANGKVALNGTLSEYKNNRSLNIEEILNKYNLEG